MSMLKTFYANYVEKLPNWTGYAVGGGAALVLTIAVFTSKGIKNQEYAVGFVGNSYAAVNDIPRLMESISDGRISQLSCLHPKGSISSILETGNGMYQRWNTDNSRIEGSYRHDFGVCTVNQLFYGQDENLMTQNKNGAYYDDGKNPCFQDDSYRSFLEKSLSNETQWDYVVLVDQSKRMSFQEYREEALWALEYNYANMFKETGATPIILDTHAFWSENTNMTGLNDVSTFASLIYEGARQYQEKLAGFLPKSQAPKIAPVGLAFLAVYEDDQEMWNKLTAYDDIHASVYGSFLSACVLHATITGKAPAKTTTDDVESLFEHSRLLKGAANGYPDPVDAMYLWKIAQKVAVKHKMPETLEIFEYDGET